MSLPSQKENVVYIIGDVSVEQAHYSMVADIEAAEMVQEFKEAVHTNVTLKSKHRSAN